MQAEGLIVMRVVARKPGFLDNYGYFTCYCVMFYNWTNAGFQGCCTGVILVIPLARRQNKT